MCWNPTLRAGLVGLVHTFDIFRMLTEQKEIELSQCSLHGDDSQQL
jgi:hypothetical protein